MKVQPYATKECTDGYICYVLKSSGRTTHMDPHLDAAMERIAAKTNSIRYTTYRVAAKLAMLSNELFLNNIPYATIIAVLERHYLQHTDNAPLVRPGRLTALLHDIFFAAQNAHLFANRFDFQLERVVAMVANLLWNIFDKDRNAALSLLELKQTLLLLCPATTYDRQIFEHFLLAADHNSCVSRYRLESMVVIMAKIFTHIDPLPVSTVSSAFGRPFFVASLTLLIDECFVQCPGPVGLNKFQFYTLWRRAPYGSASFGHFANVQALLGRMADAKDVVHTNRSCAGCDAAPIRGLCFRCEQCRKVALCFGCFGRGFAAGKHGVDHRMYEISAKVDSTQSNRLRSFLGKLCQLFSGTPTGSHATLGDDTKMHNITMETNVIQIDAEPELHDTTTTSGQETTTTSENERNCLVERPRLTVGACVDRLSPSEPLAWTISSSSNADAETLSSGIELLMQQHNRLSDWLSAQPPSAELSFLLEHCAALHKLVAQFKAVQPFPNRQTSNSQTSIRPHYSSTPYRNKSHNNNTVKLVDFNTLMANSMVSNSPSDVAVSIKGADINRSYLEANKSDLSIGDLSTWLHTRRLTDSMRNKRISMPTVSEDVDSEMSAFRDLLHVVKEILEDSYSDNAELSKVTNQLETVLGHIIDDAAVKQKSGAQSIDTYV